MSDVTKISLNNQIVLMRPAVKKAKLHLITGLVRTTRRLQPTATDKDDLDNHKKLMIREKHTRKREKLLKEINEIKKLAIDELSKYALINDKPLSVTLRDAKVSDKDRAIAKLANHKFVKETVTTFRQNYPSWKVQIPSVYSMWTFKKKFSRMMANESNSPNFVEIKRSSNDDVGRPIVIQKSKALNPKQSLAPKKTKVIKSSITSAKSEIKSKKADITTITTNQKSENQNITLGESGTFCGVLQGIFSGRIEDTNYSFVDEIVRSSETNTNEAKGVKANPDTGHKPSPDTGHKPINVRDTRNSGPTETIPATASNVNRSKLSKTAQNMQKIPIKFKNKVSDDKFTNTISNEIVVKMLDLTALGDDDFFVSTNIVTLTDDVTESTEHGVKSSSFFINADGEAGSDSEVDEFKDNFRDDFAVVDARTQSQSGWKCLYSSGRRMESNASSRPRNRFERRSQIRELGMRKLGIKLTRVSKKSRTPTSNWKNDKAEELAKPVAEQKLHPSWEAKRKLVEQSKNIVAFQGKKITFDD